MSKQLGNDIELALTDEETAARVMEAVTDPARRYRSDPGHPEACNVYSLHKAFFSDKLEQIESDCRNAAIGCVDCKKLLAKEINEALAPFRERRNELAGRSGYTRNVLLEGAHRIKPIAEETLKEVKENMGLA